MPYVILYAVISVFCLVFSLIKGRQLVRDGLWYVLLLLMLAEAWLVALNISVCVYVLGGLT